MEERLAGLSNASVFWDSDFVGLSPTIAQAEAERIVEQGEQAIPALIAALSDPDKFVVAHVLLTPISGVEYQVFPAWNGLHVDIAANGAVTIDPDQRFELITRWTRWQQTNPRPPTLPPAP